MIQTLTPTSRYVLTGKANWQCATFAGCQHTAVKQFNEWIRTAPGLEERLLATGMKRGSRHYTPAQVQLIVNVFGEP